VHITRLHNKHVAKFRYCSGTTCSALSVEILSTGVKRSMKNFA